jgi:hypothetical protein
MNPKTIAHRFAHMGARFRLVRPENLSRDRRRTDYALDLITDKHGQRFELQVTARREAELGLTVLHCDRLDRHLLLLVKTPDANDSFLCGFDEREWFVAAVPGGPATILHAKLALQPAEVRDAGLRLGLSDRERALRHNRAFIRQGEWFFVPAPELHVEKKQIILDEPIRRGGGKAHMVAELFRTKGEEVHVCSQYPNGLTKPEYQRVLLENPDAADWPWERRFRDAEVYARGAIRHGDHATITLPGWHRVWMNTETQTRQMANLAFLD